MAQIVQPMPSVESSENVKLLIEEHNKLLRAIQSATDFAGLKTALEAAGTTPGHVITFKPALAIRKRFPLRTE